VLLAIALSSLVGVALGLLGGGGSILLLPILVYIAGLETRSAIATSLVAVGATSLVAMLAHARAGRVELRSGLVFAATGMTGAFAGGRLAGHLPASLLLGGFALMMFATGVAMLRPRVALPRLAAGTHPRPAKLALAGLGVGAVTGLVGAGGGFVIVPALLFFARLPMHRAAATSLLVIALNSAAGLLGHLGHTAIDWQLALFVTLSAIAGSAVGARLAGRVPETSLRHGFAWFVLAMALFVVGQQLVA
jgi:uncharacterized protein